MGAETNYGRFQQRFVSYNKHTVNKNILCTTPWTVTLQAPLSMGLSRQEDRSGLPFPIPFISLCRPQLGLPGGLVVKNPPANAGDGDSVPGLGRSPEEGKETHSSILAWRTP